jgi:thiol-disulfide isomerase/thioredoxin
MAATRKQKKRNDSTRAKTTMGSILPPVDITDTTQLNELDKRLSAGPLTLVLVYADWCGHCQRFKPVMDELEATPGRSIQTARVRDDVFSKSSIANTPIEGYPSVLLIKNNKEPISFEKEDGEVTSVLPVHNDKKVMTSIVKNAGTPEGLAIVSSANKTSPLKENTLKNEMSVANSGVSTNVSQQPTSQTTPTFVSTPAPNSGSAVRSSQNRFVPLTPSSTALPPNSSVDIQKARINQASTPLTQTPNPSQVVGAQKGGGLYSMLSKVAYQYGPAAALLLAGSVVGNRTQKVKSRRSFKKRSSK